jgi:hypothetical protein
MSSHTLSAPVPTPAGQPDVVTRLAVTWQHPVNRRHEPVGLLTHEGGMFRFRYLARADEVEGFQPFLGFPAIEGDYIAPRLFPLFAQRVMSPSRPDYRRYLEALWLPPDATAWAILARSQGQREGDGIRVFVEPVVDDDGATRSTFLVHGVRHRLHADPRVEGAIAALAAGDDLQLVDEPDNPADARAVLITDQGRIALGWVPSVLLPYVHLVLADGVANVRVERANDSTVPPGYRLLVTLGGNISPSYRAFDGPAWEFHAS